MSFAGFGVLGIIILKRNKKHKSSEHFSNMFLNQWWDIWFVSEGFKVEEELYQKKGLLFDLFLDSSLSGRDQETREGN